MEGLGGDEIGAWKRGQFLLAALAEFSRGVGIEGEEQELVAGREPVFERVAGLGDHGRRFARSGGRDDLDVIVHADAGVDLFVREGIGFEPGEKGTELRLFPL